MRIAATTALLALALVSCDDEGPCDEYVDYMCDCHPDGVDCEQLQIEYEDPTTDLEDYCAIELDKQEEADDDNGHECGDREGDTGA